MNTFFRNSLYSRFLWTSICCLWLKSLPKGRPLSVSSGSFQLRFVAWAFLWCIDNKNRWQNSENQELHDSTKIILKNKKTTIISKMLDLNITWIFISIQIHFISCKNIVHIKEKVRHAWKEMKHCHSILTKKTNIQSLKQRLLLVKVTITQIIKK